MKSDESVDDCIKRVRDVPEDDPAKVHGLTHITKSFITQEFAIDCITESLHAQPVSVLRNPAHAADQELGRRHQNQTYQYSRSLSVSPYALRSHSIY